MNKKERDQDDEVERRKQFYFLLNEGARLVMSGNYEEGIAKIKEAQIYATAETPLAKDLDKWLKLAANMRDLSPNSVDVKPK